MPIYSPRLPDRLGTDKVSGAGWREYRADELVWAGLMTGLRGPVLRFMRVDAQIERFSPRRLSTEESETVENLRAANVVNGKRECTLISARSTHGYALSARR